eukprot:s1805_g2.t4
MGESLSVESRDLVTESEPAGNSSLVDGRAPVANMTDIQRRQMHDAISDAHALAARPSQIVLPWEEPSMSWIFGDGDQSVIPDVAPVWGYIEPEVESEQHREVAVAVESRPTVFESAISFGSFRTCHLSDSDQLSILSQKFEALVSINYAAFDLGVQIFDSPYAVRVQTVSEVLGGKSPATLSRRLSQITRYVKWASEEAKREPFPVSAELIKNYIRHLRNQNSGHTAFKGFMEVLKFMKHVVGLDCDMSAFDSAWVSGIIRAAQQSRPLRKQSTTLNVKTLMYLESYLSDSTKAVVDRYACGVFLFAVYARARFGDLRKISKVLIDVAPDTNEGSLGFLEAHSASHKMRATGNRLGAHLPLIAPIKGVGQRAWGHDFIAVSQLTGLDLREWVSGRPFLPAPSPIGNWTDRAVTSSEVQKWMHGVLAACTDFSSVGFTPHGCKATTLLMLSRYGASPDDRLILGHHQINRGALEVYARDLQSAPLRVLEQMFADIRSGRFAPDVTRSGMFTPDMNPPTLSMPVGIDVSPAPTTPLDDTFDNASLPSMGPSSDRGQVSNSAAQPVTGTLTEDIESESSGSGFDTDESDTEEIIKDLATTERPPGHWHPGCTLYQHRCSKLVHALSLFGHRQAFVCGRSLSKEYILFETKFFVDAMKCQQCDKGQTPTEASENASALGAVVKRARKQ